MNFQLFDNSPIANMIAEMHSTTIVFEQRVQWLHDLRDVGASVVTIEVKIKRIENSRAIFHKNHCAGNGIMDLARCVRSRAKKPRGRW